MIDTAIHIAISFAGVVVFGVAVLLAIVGFVVLCLARRGDRPVTVSTHTAGAWALLLGALVASNVFVLLA
jgi:hypothetical protein